MRVAIIGAGITGLTAAFDLQKSGQTEVRLFEASPRVGGKVQTLHEGPFLIEQAAESVFSAKPWAIELMRELGMESELIEPLGNEFSILHQGALFPVARPLASFALTEEALDRAAFLNPEDRKRALQEADIPPGNGKDESVASFFRRRFGRAFSQLVVEPLLAGTHAGDPEKLSMVALYPAYLAAEQKHGSLSKPALERLNGDAPRVGFVTLRDGMERLTAELASRLTGVRLSSPVSSIRRHGSGVTVLSASGEEPFDHVIVTVPSFAAAPMLEELCPAAAAALGAIRYVSTAVVSFAFGPEGFERPPQGNGFLVPFSEPSPITGCTWSSNKWEGRAPEGRSLVRVFLGRDGSPSVDTMPDTELLSIASEALNHFLGPRRPPVYSRVDRWTNGLPQYDLGHLDKLNQITAALQNLPVTLAGCSYRGNSISDCVRQAREAAQIVA